MYYVKIIRKSDDEVVEKMGPMPEGRAERVARGASINLNHDEYHVAIEELTQDEIAEEMVKDK